MGSAEELIRGLQFDSPLGATLTIAVALLSLVLVAAIHTAISGLIGNRFDAGVLAVRKALRSRYIVITAWSLTVIPVIVLVLLAVGLLVRTYWVFVITSVSVMLLLGVSLFIPLYRVFRNKAPPRRSLGVGAEADGSDASVEWHSATAVGNDAGVVVEQPRHPCAFPSALDSR